MKDYWFSTTSIQTATAKVVNRHRITNATFPSYFGRSFCHWFVISFSKSDIGAKFEHKCNYSKKKNKSYWWWWIGFALFVSPFLCAQYNKKFWQEKILHRLAMAPLLMTPTMRISVQHIYFFPSLSKMINGNAPVTTVAWYLQKGDNVGSVIHFWRLKITKCHIAN